MSARRSMTPDGLLGGHELDLPLEHPLRRVLGQAVARLGDAEVDELGDAVHRHEDVLRRDVAVHDVEQRAVPAADLVRGVQTAARVGEDAEHDPGGISRPFFCT